LLRANAIDIKQIKEKRCNQKWRGLTMSRSYKQADRIDGSGGGGLRIA
jgi:hypothetical protein